MIEWILENFMSAYTSHNKFSSEILILQNLNSFYQTHEDDCINNNGRTVESMAELVLIYICNVAE